APRSTRSAPARSVTTEKLEAEPVLLETASRVDPPRLRQAVTHLCRVVDPDAADRKAAGCHERRGLWLVRARGGCGGGAGRGGGGGGPPPRAPPDPPARPARRCRLAYGWP